MFLESTNKDYPSVEISGGRTLTQRLEVQKAELEARLKKITDALDALRNNPGLQELIDTISRVY